ncbi:hypothetical protein Tco_0782716 [Tanacetum coccineum]
MGDEHLSTIPATESEEVINSSVGALIPIPSESEGILENTCDVPIYDDLSPLNVSNDRFEISSIVNNESISSDNKPYSYEDIDYIDASPPRSELVSFEEDSYFEEEVIEDEILRERLLESPPSFPISVKDSDFLPELETFRFDIEEKNSGSPTIHTDISLSDFDHFYFEIKPDPGYFTICEVGYIVLPTQTTLHLETFLELETFKFDIDISLPDFEYFHFETQPDLTSNPGIHENAFSTTHMNLPIEDNQSPLLAFVVWYFLPYLTYPIIPPYLHSVGNEDTIFDPGIFIYHFLSRLYLIGVELS